MRLAADMLIDGRYLVVERLGVGGMADVYLAEDTHLGRQVALKVLHSRFAEDREFVERFRREASAAAGLQHPNVVSVYDRGSYEDTYYIAMEYLDGRTLSDLIADGVVDVATAVDVVSQILAAARFAHRRGVIHRDLKPHNVLVDSEGRAKVADFGIARAGASDMTQTGSVMGTAHYLSPEQAQGLDVAATSDLYSIGVILYQCLTGRVPFEGDSAVAVALKQVSEEPVPPSKLNPLVPEGLDAVVLRSLAKDPEERFQSADEFLGDLEKAAAGVPLGEVTTAFAKVSAPPRGLTRIRSAAPSRGGPPPVGPAPRRRRWRWALAAVLVAIVAGVATYLLTRPDQVTVPSVTGQSLATASRTLAKAGLEPDVRFVQNDADRDTVLEQDPTPGRHADTGSTITLTVSQGPPIIAVPTVRGRPARQTAKRLRRLGFDVEVVRRDDQTIAAGRVIGTEPAAGTELQRRSTLTLVVSKGRGRAKVPDVKGLGRSEAEAALRDAGLSPRVSERSSSKPEGEVLEQSPAPGTQLQKGQSVSLVVSKGERKVVVPQVQGLPESQAVARLRSRGFDVQRDEQVVTSAEDDGIVINQLPSPGGTAAHGDTVTVFVGRFEGTDQGQATP